MTTMSLNLCQQRTTWRFGKFGPKPPSRGDGALQFESARARERSTSAAALDGADGREGDDGREPPHVLAARRRGS